MTSSNDIIQLVVLAVVASLRPLKKFTDWLIEFDGRLVEAVNVEEQ